MNKFYLVLILIVAAIGVTRADAADERMNVLFLVADDLNSWMLEDADRYAGKVIAPNLRKLAGSGVNFTHAYTAAPVCSPSRTAFFSGVAPWKSGKAIAVLEKQHDKPFFLAYGSFNPHMPWYVRKSILTCTHWTRLSSPS